MRKIFVAVSSVAFLCASFMTPASLTAQEKSKTKKEAVKDHLESHVQVHGFIRNYFAFDTRESVSGTGDLFYYLPKDENLNALGEDLNAQNQFRFLSLTSRLWVDVNGYQIQNTKIGAKIEADFYTGLSGVTGTAQFRLRQAFVTLGWEQDKCKESLKIGQAWHPMAVDMPDVFSLNTGAPFGPFSRTPQVTLDASFGKHLGLTAAAIWQQQYTSAGPSGASANYMKYGLTPELYLGLNLNAGGFLARVGVDMLSIKPANTREKDGTTVKVKDRITTVSPFMYMQYKTKFGEVPFSVKAKTIYAQAGEHVSLNGGYAVSAMPDGSISYAEDGISYNYTPTRNSSTWVSLSIGKKFQGVLFGGYVKNFGTAEDIFSVESLYFSKNSFKNINSMWRLTPTFMYNLGKLTLGLEYEITSAQYGEFEKDSVGQLAGAAKKALATENLHWVTNNRVQAMVKFTF